MAPKRKGNFRWKGSAKNRKGGLILSAGVRGFMTTCNGTEKQCLIESYNLLNEFANKLYGEEVSGDISDDAEDELALEAAAIREKTEKPMELQRFQAVDSGVKNRLFIQTSLPDPVGLVYYMLKNAQASEGLRTRYLMRLIPIEVTCKAYEKDIEAAAGELFDKYFTKEGKTFCIVVMRHNNDSISRMEIIKILAEMIKFRNPDNKVNLKHSELTVLVEVMRSVCCLSVLPDYMKLHKYNIMELLSESKTDQQPNE